MRNGMIAAIGAGLLAIAGTASAQPIVVGSGPPQPAPGSGDSARTASDYRDVTAEVNERAAAGTRIGRQEDRRAKPKAVPATTADIKAGAALRDINGVAIGTVVSVDADQAVVDTGQTKIGVPLIAFGKDNKGLLLGMTADKFNELVAAAHAKSQASN